jgi:hypothetical protein
MGRIQGSLLFVVLAALFAWSATVSAAGGDGVPRLTKDELKGLLGSPDVVVLDVRFDGNLAPSRITGAVHEDPEKVDSWAGKYPREKRIVLYCS